MNIVCFSDILWDSIWQRHQNILTRLPRSWKILFIEPTSLAILFKEPRRAFSRKSNNIIVVSLPTIPLIDRAQKMRKINDVFIYLWLRAILKMHHIKEPMLLYYEPRFSRLIGKFNEKLVIYDCVDDKLAFSGVPKWISEYIEILVNKSNIIFVTSFNLYNMMKTKKIEDVYFIGNGVDVDHFRKAFEDIPIPKDVQELKRPILGYIGMIDDWMDFDLIKKLSLKYPDSSIVLVGPVNPAVQKIVNQLKFYDNIYFVGKRSYDILPYYLKSFDIALIPFKKNELTESVNPVKLYEYMASGKKIVTSDMPELHRYEEFIFIARDHDEFINHIYNCLDKSDTSYINIGLDVAEDNSWDSKAKEIIDVILNKYYCI